MSDDAMGADGGVPASSNVRGAAYPRVHPDARVTFRLEAPGAHEVAVQPGVQPDGSTGGLGAGPFPMARDEAGVWSVTTPPAVPGFHYYWLLVDGVAVNDPGSQTYIGYGKPTSAVEVPEPDGGDFYAIQDVPHGEVRERWYYARAAGDWRRAYVYTPPGYDATPERRYPVLYLQHGGGEDETGWQRQGRVSFILDNLLAAGQIVPMLVVMANGYAGAPESARPGPAGRRRRAEAFGATLLADLVPLIDGAYRTLPDPAHRALAGLSMGGAQALHVGLAHPEAFAWIGAVSAAGLETFDPGAADSPFAGGADHPFAEAAAFNRRTRLLWLSAGTAEARFHEGLERLHELLGARGIEHAVYASPGTAHEWQTWRRSLRAFAPRLFRA